MRIRVITFDLDNTLWDVEPALLRAEEAQRRWLIEHRPGTAEKLDHQTLWELKKRLWKARPDLAHNVSGMRKTLLLNLQQEAGYSEAVSTDGAEQAFAAFLVERHKVELYSDALQVLESLAERYQLGALTNGNADVYKTDAGEYFDFAFLAEDFAASKPAPAMFEAALQRTGASPAEVLHVGDNPEHDVLGALRVGMRAVWVNAGRSEWPAAHTSEALRPDATIQHIGELPRALASLTGPGSSA